MATIIVPTRPDTAEAVSLIAELEDELGPMYPEESQHGYSVDEMVRNEVAFFVIRHRGMPAGCGGVQMLGDHYGEIKRMYVRPEFRGLGLGALMVDHLAAYTRERGVGLLRLETGIYQTAAIGLYRRAGFRRIAPFGPYRDDPLSMYLEKRLEPASHRSG